MLWIVGATLIGGALSLAVVALVVWRMPARLQPRLVSYAVGVLLATAFLDLLPEAFERGGAPQPLLATLLGGVLGFFVLEKVAIWRHHHHGEQEHGGHAHPAAGPGRRSVGVLIIVGDAFHNFVDGVLLAAAFLTDIKLGVITAAAVVAHEIPQEAGDFAVLLHAGFDRRAALALNALSSSAAIAGGIAGYFLLGHALGVVPHVLALAAASFIYIAVADLMPGMHEHHATREVAWQIALIAAGVATIMLVHHFLQAL